MHCLHKLQMVGGAMSEEAVHRTAHPFADMHAYAHHTMTAIVNARCAVESGLGTTEGSHTYPSNSLQRLVLESSTSLGQARSAVLIAVESGVTSVQHSHETHPSPRSTPRVMLTLTKFLSPTCFTQACVTLQLAVESWLSPMQQDKPHD